MIYALKDKQTNEIVYEDTSIQNTTQKIKELNEYYGVETKQVSVTIFNYAGTLSNRIENKLTHRFEFQSHPSRESLDAEKTRLATGQILRYDLPDTAEEARNKKW